MNSLQNTERFLKVTCFTSLQFFLRMGFAILSTKQCLYCKCGIYVSQHYVAVDTVRKYFSLLVVEIHTGLPHELRKLEKGTFSNLPQEKAEKAGFLFISLINLLGHCCWYAIPSQSSSSNLKIKKSPYFSKVLIKPRVFKHPPCISSILL